jgi:hypothetical protein
MQLVCMCSAERQLGSTQRRLYTPLSTTRRKIYTIVYTLPNICRSQPRGTTAVEFLGFVRCKRIPRCFTFMRGGSANLRSKGCRRLCDVLGLLYILRPHRSNFELRHSLSSLLQRLSCTAQAQTMYFFVLDISRHPANSSQSRSSSSRQRSASVWPFDHEDS